MPSAIVGLIRVRDHCLFTWRGIAPEVYTGEGWPPRAVEVRDDHCQACIDEMGDRLGFVLEDTRGMAGVAGSAARR
jgi:hypothetical protein